jgi:carbamoyltransferase
MTNRRFHRLFGAPPRKPEGKLSELYMDVAASIQKVTEEIVLRAARYAHELTGEKDLCLAGGVALNCVSNGRILREGPFEHIWIQPASGDAGGALGAALFVWHQLLGNERRPELPDAQRGSLLGPAFSEQKIKDFLDTTSAVYDYIADDDELCDRVVDLLTGGKVVGWFQGRMEFGPRALGSRSIVGDARSTTMQRIMNLKVKFRESFRPFAPSVLRDDVHRYFEVLDGADSPYMLVVADVRRDRRTYCEHALSAARGLAKLPIIRSDVPAVTHVDFSARLQTVDEGRHGRYYRLIKAFRDRTGCPVVINTSFNVRGEPIVCSPEDAYVCFMATNMDALVLERFVLHKEHQPDAEKHVVDEYLAKFQLD